MIVTRIWKKDTRTIEYTDTLTTWDTGSTLYERLSDGTERSWKVIGRETNESGLGFTETLSELPAYATPTELVWKETVPAKATTQGFQIPGWSVLEVRPKHGPGSQR